MRQSVDRRGDGAEQTIHPHAHHEAIAERFDMNIAGPQFHGFFEHVVDGAHNRSTAREIAQTFNVVVGAAARRSAIPRCCFLTAKLLAKNRRNILEGRDVDRHRSAKDDFGGVDGGGIARVGDGEPIGAFGGFIGEDCGIAQKAGRKTGGQGGAPQQVAATSAASVRKTAPPRRRSHSR